MLGNIIILALREIRRNVLRSFLTIQGIIIGVAAVITMVTVGGSATAQIQQQISSMGSNLLMVMPGKRIGPTSEAGNVLFKEEDAVAIARDIPSVAAGHLSQPGRFRLFSRIRTGRPRLPAAIMYSSRSQTGLSKQGGSSKTASSGAEQRSASWARR